MEKSYLIARAKATGVSLIHVKTNAAFGLRLFLHELPDRVEDTPKLRVVFFFQLLELACRQAGGRGLCGWRSSRGASRTPA